MKKAISFLLIFAMLFTLAACGKKEEAAPTAAPESAATEAPVVSETAAPVPETEPIRILYADQLVAYHKALSEGWDAEKYADAGLNYMPSMVGDISEVGYCLDDFDGDGVPELAIGIVGGCEIMAMYTMVGEDEFQVIDATERSSYWMSSDGMVVNRASNSAFSSGYRLSVLSGGKLNFQDALIFDSNADAENPWFYAQDDDWDVSNDTPIATDEADLIVAQLEEDKMPIAFVSFADFNN